VDAHGGRQRREDLVFDALRECRIHFLLLDGDLLLADRLGEVVDRRHDLLDCDVRGFERLDDLLLAHFLRAGFDHDEAVLAAGDDEIELAVLALGERRVDDVLAVNQADAHAGDGLLEGMSDRASAVEAPVRARTSVSFALSAESTSAMICVSKRQPSGNSGRIGRSMTRLVRTSFSDGLPSRLKKPPGIRPDA
jgi:hypothetical protein